jgi:hypothetical protein
MALSDLALLFFILITFLLRRKASWKRTGIYVLAGIMIGDLTGAILFAIFYHSYPAILLWVRYLMTLGAIIGGVCDWLIPTPPKTLEDNKGLENPK